MSTTVETQLIGQVQQVAEAEGSTVSRVVDRLLRTGLAAEEAGSYLEQAATRLEAAIESLDRWPYFNGPDKQIIMAEAGLTSCALNGEPVAMSLVPVLSPEIFLYPIHRTIWSFLKSGDVVRPGDGMTEVLAKILAERFADQVPNPEFRKDRPPLTIEEYTSAILDTGAIHWQHAARSALLVLDAYMMRTDRNQPGLIERTLDAWKSATQNLSSEDLKDYHTLDKIIPAVAIEAGASVGEAIEILQKEVPGLLDALKGDPPTRRIRGNLSGRLLSERLGKERPTPRSDRKT